MKAIYAYEVEVADERFLPVLKAMVKEYLRGDSKTALVSIKNGVWIEVHNRNKKACDDTLNKLERDGLIKVNNKHKELIAIY